MVNSNNDDLIVNINKSSDVIGLPDFFVYGNDYNLYYGEFG